MLLIFNILYLIFINLKNKIMEGLGAIFVIAIIIGVVFLMRWLGAWMLRIDEVINIQSEILKELKKRN